MRSVRFFCRLTAYASAVYTVHSDRTILARALICILHPFLIEIVIQRGKGHRRILLASLAIRSCFVDTLSGFKAPLVFLKAVLLQRCSASLGRVRLSSVPRRPRYYQSTKTPCAEYGVAYVFASPPPLPVSLRSLPRGGDFHAGPVPFSATAPPAIWKWVARRDSQVPGESIPYLCHALRFRPVRQASPYRPARCCPRYSDDEDTRDSYFGTQYRGFSIRCLRFK